MSERESIGGIGSNGNSDPLGGLQLDPSNELKFKGPFDDYVTVSLTIKNPTEKRIAFKIKTTAPKRYCVKPNSGVLDQGQIMKVNVLLQPFNYDPNEKNKHKFMVQYLYLNESEMSLSVEAILTKWKDFPSSRLLDLKLKCCFEFTEAEQLKLANLAPVSEATIIPQSKTLTTTTTTTTSAAEKIQEANMDKAPSEPSSSLTKQFVNTHESTNSNNLVNTTPNTSSIANMINYANINNKNNISPSSISSNNDNQVNELKLVRQENELFKKEISRLKEEETRLRKLALSSGSGSSKGQLTAANADPSLTDTLSNKYILIIIALIAIILYLVMFR
jgi:hypothetical protein